MSLCVFVCVCVGVCVFVSVIVSWIYDRNHFSRLFYFRANFAKGVREQNPGHMAYNI